MTSHIKDLFVPAAGVHWLTPFYDPAVALLMRERAWRPRLVEQVAPRSGYRILDLGCGTGTLSIMLKQACPRAEIIGLDVDPDALRIARTKANAAGTLVHFWQGRADDNINIPMLRSASVDRVVSSLLFHHLTTEQKLRALMHARRLLRFGGTIHVADWGRPANALMRLLFYFVQVLDGFANTYDNVQGRLPDIMREAGFSDVVESGREATLLGSLCFYRGVKQ